MRGIIGYLAGSVILGTIVGFVGGFMGADPEHLILASLIVIGFWVSTGWVLLQLHKHLEAIHAALKRLEQRNDLKLDP